MLKYLFPFGKTLLTACFFGQLAVPILNACFSSPLKAQNLIIDQVRQAVPVLRENMVRAKQEALLEGKRSLVENAIMRFLVEKDMQIIKPVLEEHVLKEPNHVFDSFRVIEEEVFEDRTMFALTLEGRIFRSRLLATLRQLGLSTIGEQLPAQRVALILDHKGPLSAEITGQQLTNLLKVRLRPYRLRLDSLFLWKGELTAENLGSWLGREKKTSALKPIPLVLSLKSKSDPEKIPSDQQENGGILLEFWNAENPNLIANVAAETVSASEQPDVFIEELMDQLMLVWHPLLRSLNSSRRQEKQVRIHISGLPNPIQEQNFIKHIFLDQTKWKNLSLYALKRDSVVYQVSYTGKKKQILKDISRNLIGTLFKLKALRWENAENLFIVVNWLEKPALLNAYVPVKEVEEFFMQEDEFAKSAPEPELMVPVPSDGADYELPVNTVVYGQIRNRGDSTTFRIDSLNETSELNFTWYRIGETNLRPMITLFNAKQETVKRVQLRGYKRFRFSYIVPSGDSTMFIRISEETGAIEGVTGSFHFFHYLLEGS